MNNRKPGFLPFRSKGITLIEILIALGILIILLSFAMPSVSGAATRAEMKAAVENVEWSLQSARNLARMTESSVTVHIPAAIPDKLQTITFSNSGRDGESRISQLQEFTLPAEIVLVSGQEAFEFDSRGLVKTPGLILLASNVDESVKRTVTIN